MNTKVKPIASPKAGTATPLEPSGSTTTLTVSRGRRSAAWKPTERAAVRRYPLLRTVTGVPSGDRVKMLAKIRKGFSFDVIEKLEVAFGVPRKEIASVLSIPTSTLNRRMKVGRLDPEESDRVARLASLKDSVLEMMQGDDEAAKQWLHTPVDVFGDETPMIHASTYLGTCDVEDLIGRIRHGVFS